MDAMNRNTISRRRVLKTLGAGALSLPLVGPESASLLGQVGAIEKRAAAQIPISTGNPGVPLMCEVWGCPPTMHLPQDLRMANDVEFTGMLKTAKELGVTGIEYYVSWGFAEPEEGMSAIARHQFSSWILPGRLLSFNSSTEAAVASDPASGPFRWTNGWTRLDDGW